MGGADAPPWLLVVDPVTRGDESATFGGVDENPCRLDVTSPPLRDRPRPALAADFCPLAVSAEGLFHFAIP